MLAFCAIIAILGLLPLSSARAGESIVNGTLSVGEESIELRHVVVLLHDNAEGLLSRTPELRICLSESPVPAQDLRGIAFPQVERNARKGTVRGLLLTLDPANPGDIATTLLYPPPDDSHYLMTETIVQDAKSLWTEWELSGTKLSAVLSSELDPGSAGWLDPGARWAAPIARETPITEDLTGDAALASAPVHSLRARFEALAAGKVEQVRALSTVESNHQMDTYAKANGLSDEQLSSMMQNVGSGAAEVLERISRVVVREDQAVVIYTTDDNSKQWATLRLEGGVWKSVD